MELDRIEKSLRRLRKLLKSLPENPAPEQVHQLHTRTRHVEAVAAAIGPVAYQETHHLLKALKPVQKAAGNVRDMDVLAAGVLALQQDSNSESLTRLIDHLTARRIKNADKLTATLNRQRKSALHSLKDYARVIESITVCKKPVRSEGVNTPDTQENASSAVSALIADMARWPALNSRNLHAFRIKVKELFYVLQVFPEPDQELIGKLATVKEVIGDWHDWRQLARIARQVLDTKQDSALIAQIDTEVKQKFARALAASNALRHSFHPLARTA